MHGTRSTPHFNHVYIRTYFLGVGQTIRGQYCARDPSSGPPTTPTNIGLTDGLSLSLLPWPIDLHHMINNRAVQTVRAFALTCALLAGGCSKAVLPFTRLELSLAEMQARYSGVAHPPATWRLRTDELRGEQFELFDGELVLGVFHAPAGAETGGEQTVVHFVVPNVRIKMEWSIDGGSVETDTFPPTTVADSTAYFDRSLHGSVIFVELLELNGVACDRKAKFRIR